MVTPKVSIEVARARAAVIEKYLRQGYAPVGQYSTLGSAVEAASRELKLNSGNLVSIIERAGVTIDWSLYRPRYRVSAGSRRVDEAPVESPAPVEAPAVQRKIVLLQDRVRQLEAEIRDFHRTEISAEKVREELYGLASRPPPPPDWLSEAPRVGGSSPGTPIFHLSDVHFEERVRPEEVGGMNAYDREIAATRIKRATARVIDICHAHMVAPDYRGIIVLLGGDLMTGEIHAELAATNSASPMEAMLELETLLIGMIESFAQAFERVFVVGVVGNHGRLDLKPRFKGKVYRSLEWNVLQHVERYFATRYAGSAEPGVQFLVPPEVDAHFSVHGHRYMLTHGDALGVKGGDGIIGALGPIMRGRTKTHRSESQIGRAFNTIVMGHWHQLIPLPGCRVNGSLIGYNEYARLALRAEYQPPMQDLWFHHPKYGVTFSTPIYLDEPQSPGGDPGWVSWQAAS